MYKPYEFFKRNYQVWKKGQLTQTFEIDNITDIPKGVAVHMFNNINALEYKDTYDIGAMPLPLVEHLNGKKFVCTPPLVTKAPKVKKGDDTYIPPACTKTAHRFYSTGLASDILKWSKQTKKEYKVIINNKLLTNYSYGDMGWLAINHNPMFRIRVAGSKLRAYKKFTLLLRHLINSLCLVAHNNANKYTQYISIPLSNRVFKKNDFFQSEKDISIMLSKARKGTPSKLPMDLNEAHDAIFNKLTMAAIRYTESNHYFMYMHFLFLLFGSREASLFSLIPDEYRKQINFLFYNHGKYVIYNWSDLEEMADNDKMLVWKVLAQLNSVAYVQDDMVRGKDDADTFTGETVDTKLLTPVTKETEFGGNETIAYPSVSKDEVKKSVEATINEINESAVKVIEEAPLSEKQKARMMKLKDKYKTIEIDGKSIDEIVHSVNEPTIDGNYIDVLEDRVPQKSMLKASTIQFDEEYIKKTMDKDIFTSLLSFNKLGMFITKVTKKPIIDQLNRKMDYAVTFTDLNGKTHTSHFTIPLIEDGKYLINGAYKYFKKQAINLPICKINDTRVSLSSNLNKTLVERNTTKAHSYTTAIEKMFKEGNCKVDVGNTDYSKGRPLPYDFTALASRYRSVSNGNMAFNFTGDFSSLGPTRKSFVLKEKEITAFKRAMSAKKPYMLNRRVTTHIADGVYWINTGDTAMLKREGGKTVLLPMKRISQRDKIHQAEIMLGGVLCGGMIDGKKTYGIIIDKNNELHTLNLSNGTLTKRKNSLRVALHKLNQAQKLDTRDLNYLFDEGPSKPLTGVYEWVHIKYLDKKFPLVFVLGYRYGLKHMLDYLKVDYRTYDGPVPRDARTNEDFVIRFKDRTLVFNRYPLIHSWIFAGLSYIDTEKYEFELFESRDVYASVLEDKGISINYLKGIDGFFDLFIDGPTRDVLVQMKEPTNIRDLLIRSVALLTTVDHRPAPSMANFRLRSYERIPAFIYNEFARRYAQYMTEHSDAKKFTINPQAVYQKIISDTASDAMVDICNPIHQIKEKTAITYTGMSGRSGESFTVDDRVFPDDGIGILSEATVDNAKVGMNAYAPMDASIVNSRGMLDTNREGQESTQILSVSSTLMPCATQDDGKRANFISIQLSATLPQKEGEVGRIRTGYEWVLPHRVGMPYAYIAKDDGVIVACDPKTKMFRIRYKDKNLDDDIVDYSEQYTNSSGLYVVQKIECRVEKVGQKFKKSDVICFNPQFFESNPYDTQVAWKHGHFVNVCFMESDVTMEDSSCISKELGESLVIEPTYERTLVLDKKTIIHEYANIGESIASTEKLMTIEETEFGDIEVNQNDDKDVELLSQLSRNAPKAKHTGDICKIKVFYGCPLSEMSRSMKSFVTKHTKKERDQSKFAEKSPKAHHFTPPAVLPEGSKLSGAQIDKDTVVIKYYIKSRQPAFAGDKIVVDSSLKSVISHVFTKNPVTESGIIIDVKFPGISVQHRIITSPFGVGINERNLIALEKEIIDIFFDE